MMMDFLLPVLDHSHRYLLGYTLLGLVVILVGWSGVCAYQEKALEGAGDVFSKVVTGLLDLQILVGISYFLVLGLDWWALVKHPLCMILGTALVHTGNRLEGWGQVGVYGAAFLLLVTGWHFTLN